jgi:hypothetical protein
VAALPIAAASQGTAAPSGTVSDPSGRLISGVSVRLSALEGEGFYQTLTDAQGAFQFPAIPSGEYMMSARQFGFLSVRRRVSITAATAPMAIGLQVGTLQETVTVQGGKGDVDGPRSEERASQFGTTACTPRDTGGHLVPPMKIRDVRPRYKKAWFDARLEGNILMQARIGVDGRIREVEVVSPVNADLEEEAIGAVSQWEFTPTWLNCEPIEVRMFVTVSFTAEP